MTRTATEITLQEVSDYLTTAKGDQLSFRQVFDLVGRALPFTEGVVITTLPRGTLQVVQPARLSEAVIKGYHREAQAEDSLTWQAIAEGRVARVSDDGDEATSFVTRFMAPLSLRYAAVVPLRSPVMEGYPGALHLYRNAEAGDFNEGELQALTDLAQRIDAAVDAARAARRALHRAADPTPGTRIFLFDAQQRPIPVGEPVKVDARLHQNMVEAVRNRLAQLAEAGDSAEPVSGERILLADLYGDYKTFRVVTYAKYPALGDGAFVALNLIPCPGEWATLKQTDFAADAELSRLVPALRFMAAEFHRSPTLVEIAKTVHLSPFHFHRRFTELMGLTPKHFLLDCQIDAAKRALLAGEKELSDIASDCGFAHQSHFTSRFKQATGLTPTRWRRMAMDRQNEA